MYNEDNIIYFDFNTIFCLMNYLWLSFSLLITSSLPIVYFTFMTSKDYLKRVKQWEKSIPSSVQNFL